jgi:hypothetical protein
MNIIQSIVRNLMDNRPNSAGVAFDVSGLSIEDALQLMIMLVAGDRKRDLKDLLAEMDATRLKRRALREAAARAREHRRQARAMRALAQRAKLAAARERRRAWLEARADALRRRREARAMRTAAQREKRAARRHLRPNRKGWIIPALIVCGLLVVSLMGILFLKFIFISPPITSTQPPIPPVAGPAGPRAGTLMAWGDGSTLVFDGKAWIYRSDVSNYQFSLFVETGSCSLPDDETLAINQALQDPARANLPVQTKAEGSADPCAIQYCGWVGGRLPTKQEAALISGGLDAAANSDPAGILIGLLQPGSEKGFRCVIDSPQPVAAACQTSAFYLNGAPLETEQTATQAGQFCQKGQGYATVDFNMPDGGSIESVNGDCEVVGDHRILCSNKSGLNGDGNALIRVNGLLPAVQDGSPAAGQMQCLPEYEPNADTSAECVFNKMLPGVGNYPGLVVTEMQGSQSQMADQVSLIVYQPDVARRDCPTGQRINSATGLCEDIPPCLGGAHFDINTGLCTTATNTPLPDCANLFPGTYFNPLTGSCENIPCPDGYGWNPATGVCYPSEASAQRVPCPIGSYRDPQTQLCVSLSPHPSNLCLGGFSFDSGAQCCQTNLPSGNYPGCPAGQAFDLATGACDSENIHVGDGQILQTVAFNFVVPSCEVKDNKGGGDDGTPSAGGCSSYGDKLSCSNAGCSWDPNKNTCQ